MYKLIWCPADGESKMEAIFGAPNVEDVFRTFNDLYGNNNADWRFDGDGFHTGLTYFFEGQHGGWLITRL